MIWRENRIFNLWTRFNYAQTYDALVKLLKLISCKKICTQILLIASLLSVAPQIKSSQQAHGPNKVLEFEKVRKVVWQNLKLQKLYSCFCCSLLGNDFQYCSMFIWILYEHVSFTLNLNYVTLCLFIYKMKILESYTKAYALFIWYWHGHWALTLIWLYSELYNSNIHGALKTVRVIENVE